MCDAEHKRRLRGSDAAIAEKLLCTYGVIDYAAVYYGNDRIRIASGFLKEYEGDILRVDCRMRTALVRIRLSEKDYLQAGV